MCGREGAGGVTHAGAQILGWLCLGFGVAVPGSWDCCAWVLGWLCLGFGVVVLG